MTQWWNEQERLRALCEERDTAVNGLAIANEVLAGQRALNGQLLEKLGRARLEVVRAEARRDEWCAQYLTKCGELRAARRARAVRGLRNVVTVEINADLTGFRQAMEEVDAELRSVRRRVDDLHETPGDGGHGAERAPVVRDEPTALHGRGRRGAGRPGDRLGPVWSGRAPHGGSPALRYYLDCPLHGTLATRDSVPRGGQTCWIWMHHLGRGYDYCRQTLRVVEMTR